MADNADNNANYNSTVVITTPESSDYGRTLGDYNFLILPEAFDIGTRGQVIAVNGISNASEEDKTFEGFAITTTKNNGMVSIGGNYYEFYDVYFLGWFGIRASSDFTTVTDFSYIEEIKLEQGQVKVVSPTMYNVYHLNVNHNAPGGAINFAGKNGRLVLTAQNGGRYSEYYSAKAGNPIEYEYFLKRDEDIALRSDSYGLTPHYKSFTSNAPEMVVLEPDELFPSFTYSPYDYSASDAPPRPGQDITNYTINAAGTLTVLSDLVGKIQSNNAAFVSRYCTGTDDNGNYIWDLDVSGYQVVNAGVKADTLVLDSNFRAEIAATNNQELFRAKFGYSDASWENGNAPGRMIETGANNKFWDVYDVTVGYGEVKVGESTIKPFPPSPSLGPGGYVDDQAYKPIDAYGMIAGGYKLKEDDGLVTGENGAKTTTVGYEKSGGTSVGGGIKADNVNIESHGIYVKNLETGKRVGKWVDDEFGGEAELEYTTKQESSWAGQIIADTSNAMIMADVRYLGYIDDKTVLAAMDTTLTVQNSHIGAYGVRAEEVLNIASMGSMVKDKETVLQSEADVMQDPTITVTASGNWIYAYNMGKGGSHLENSTITAAALYAKTIYLGASRISDGKGGYLKDKDGNELILNSGGVSDTTNLSVTAYGNRFFKNAEGSSSENVKDWMSKFTDDYNLEHIYGIYAENMYLGGFDGNITISSDYAWAAGIYAGDFYSVDNLGGIITHKYGESPKLPEWEKPDKNYESGIGINAYNLTVKGVIDTVITAGVGINVREGGVLDIDAFTGRISASRYGMNIFSVKDDIINIAGAIYVTDVYDAYGNDIFTNSAITSFSALNLRISGTIKAEGEYAVRGENYVALDREKVSGNWNQFVRDNTKLYKDHVELSSTAVVEGIIDLGAGVNTLVVNSSAEFSGLVDAANGELNLTFVLDDKIAPVPTMTIAQESYDDATIKDNATITIDLNYGVKGTYTLLQYEYNASEFWAYKPELIALRYQDKTEEVYLQPELNTFNEPTGRARVTTNIAGTDVTLEFYYDETADVSRFSVELNKDMPRAAAIKTQTTVDDFVADLVYAENKKIVLDWSTLDRYVKEQLEADTLQDGSGVSFEQLTGYKVVYVLRDKDGNQLGKEVGEQYTLNVSSQDNKKELSLADLAILSGENAENIDSAKIVSITALGKDGEARDVSSTFKFSMITSKYNDERHLKKFDMAAEFADWKNLLAEDSLKDGSGSSTLEEIAYCNITFDVYSKLGLHIGTYTKYDIGVDDDDIYIDLDDVVENSVGENKLNSWQEISYMVIRQVELVDETNVLTSVRDLALNATLEESKKVVTDDQGVTTETDDVYVTLDWTAQAQDWQALLEAKDKDNVLKGDNDEPFESITGYVLDLRLISKVNGQQLGTARYTVEGGDTTKLEMYLSDIIEDAGSQTTPQFIGSVEITNIAVVGLTPELNDDGEPQYDAEGNQRFKPITANYEFTEKNINLETRADGVNFNWGIMAEDIQSQINKHLLRNANGELFPSRDDLKDYSIKYNVTFKVYNYNGDQLGKFEHDAEGFQIDLAYKDVVSKLAEKGINNVDQDDIARIEISDVAVNITYTRNGYDTPENFTVFYDYPEATQKTFCNNIVANWSVSELTPGQGSGSAIESCEVTYVVKNKRGEVIGEISGVKTKKESHTFDLTDAAKNLGVDVEEIGSVEITNVHALGAETAHVYDGDPISTDNTVYAKPEWHLDWTGLQQAVADKGEYEQLKFLSEIKNPTGFVIEYHVEIKGNETHFRPDRALKVSCDVGSYTIDWAEMVNEILINDDLVKDIEAEAANEHVPLNEYITVVIDKFTVQGTNGNGTPREQVLIGMQNDVKITNATPEEAVDIIRLDCTEFEAYLRGKDNNYTVATGDEFRNVEYTYKLHNDISVYDDHPALEIRYNDKDDNTQTITFDSAQEGKLYLKDNEYKLVDGEGSRATNNSVKSLTVESIKVDDEVFSTILFDRIAHQTTLTWDSVDGATEYTIEYVVVDTKGNRYAGGKNDTDENTFGIHTQVVAGDPECTVDLLEIARENDVDVTDLAAEIVSVKADNEEGNRVDKDDVLIPAGIQLDWSDILEWGWYAEGVTLEQDDVETYTVEYQVINKDGKKTGEVGYFTTETDATDHYILLREVAEATGVNESEIKNVVFKSITAEGHGKTRTWDFNGEKYLNLDWSLFNIPKIGGDIVTTIQVHFVNSKGEVLTTKDGEYLHEMQLDGSQLSHHFGQDELEDILGDNFDNVNGVILGKVTYSNDKGEEQPHDYYQDVKEGKGTLDDNAMWNPYHSPEWDESEVTFTYHYIVLDENYNTVGTGSKDITVKNDTEATAIPKNWGISVKNEDGTYFLITNITAAGMRKKGDSVEEVDGYEMYGYDFLANPSFWTPSHFNGDQYKYVYRDSDGEVVVLPEGMDYGDNYGEAGATSVTLEAIGEDYKPFGKFVVLDNTVWTNKVDDDALEADSTVYYVLRDGEGKYIDGDSYVYDETRPFESINLYDKFGEDKVASVAEAQIVKVEAANGEVLFDITVDPYFMVLTWENLVAPAGVTFESYDLTYVLKDKEGEILGWYEETELTTKQFKIDLTDDKGDGDVRKIASAEIVAIKAHYTDEGEDKTEIYAGFEGKMKEDEDANNVVFRLNWEEWYREVYQGIYLNPNTNPNNNIDPDNDYFCITYEALDKTGNVLGNEQKILKTTFNKYYVDREQLAAELGVAEDTISEIRMTKIELLQHSDAADAPDYPVLIEGYVYTGFQKIVSTEFQSAGFNLDWSNVHKQYMEDIADDQYIDTQNFASFDSYSVTYEIRDINGNVLHTDTADDITGSTLYVDTSNYPNAFEVEITELKIHGKEGVHTNVDLNKEFAAGNNVVLDWSNEAGVDGSPAANQTYEISIVLVTQDDNTIPLNDIAVSGTSYQVVLADLLAGEGVKPEEIKEVKFTKLEIFENLTHKNTVPVNKTTVLNCGFNSTKLDWSALAAELNQKIKGGLLKDANGNVIPKIEGYKIKYVYLDSAGNDIAYDETEVFNESSWLVNLNQEPGAVSAKLTLVEVLYDADGDGTYESLPYNWNEAVSVVSHFVENYNEFENTLTISWYGLQPEDYNLATIEQYEIEYILYNDKGKMGESIAFKCSGEVNEYTINGVDRNTNVEWRIRVLGDSYGGQVSDWSPWQSAKSAIVARQEDDFVYGDFKSNIADANPKGETEPKGVVAAIAQLTWEGVSAKNTIRKYVIEYCELPVQLKLNEMAPGVSLKDFVASNNGEGLFVYQTDAQGNQVLDSFGNPIVLARYYDKNGNELFAPVYHKEATGENLTVSQLQNQSYVYWRIRAVDDENNSSEWLAGNTFRVWSTEDYGEPEFTDFSTDTLDVNFPGFGVLSYEKTAPGYSDEVTTYEALLGWNEAFDGGSGVQSYTIKLKGKNGHTREVTVNSEDQMAYSCAHWTSSELDVDGIYAVRMMDAAGNWKALRDASGATQLYLTDVRLQKVNDTSYTLSWYSQDDFTDLNAAVFKWDPEKQEWVSVLGTDEKNNPILIDNMSVKHYDYTFVVDGLVDREYDYEIIAQDYFGNTTDGKLLADVTKPIFDNNDSASFRVDEYITPDNPSDPVLVKGALLWSAASDSESLVRKYIVKFKPSKNSSFINEDEFSTAELNEQCTVLNFNNVSGIELKTGDRYQVTINGTVCSGLFEVKEDNVLRLDKYYNNITSVSINNTQTGFSSAFSDLKKDGLQIEVFEMKTTRINTGGDYNGFCTVDCGDGTSPLNVECKDGVVFIDRDMMYKNITIEKIGGGNLFYGMVTEENAALFYRMDSSELNEALKATGYNFEIVAVDYFGQESTVLTGSIDADTEAPVFREADKQSEVSGFVFKLPKTLADEQASYEAWLGWVPADDGAGTGVRSYTIEYSKDGKQWEEIVLAPQSLYGKSVASWTSSDLKANKTYEVVCEGAKSIFVAPKSGSIDWIVDGDLNNREISIYEYDSTEKKRGDLVANLSGVREPEPADANQYSYNFIGGKTFEAWTYASSTGDAVSLNINDVFKVKVNDAECHSDVREVAGKLWLTWAVDGNDVAAGSKIVIQKRVVENNTITWQEVYNSDTSDKSKFEITKNYYECVLELPGIDSESLEYRISAVDYCNNSTKDAGNSLTGSVTVDNGKPRFSNVNVVIDEFDSNGESDQKMQPKFEWTPAVDSPGDKGIWYYEIYIGTESTDENGKETVDYKLYETILHRDSESEPMSYTVPDAEKLDWKKYHYKIVAYDYFGNSTAKTGVFGSNDTTPPSGQFNNLAEGISEYIVSAEWGSEKVITGLQEAEDGSEVKQYEDVRGKLKNAEVTLIWDWESNVANDEVLYCVSVNNGKDPEHGGISYDFWTEGELIDIEIGGKVYTYTCITFDNTQPGRPVGIFEGWDTVKWTVQVFDKSFNGGSKVSGSNLFREGEEFNFEAEDQFGNTTAIDNYVNYQEINGELWACNEDVRVQMVNKPENLAVEYVWDTEEKVQYPWTSSAVNAKRDCTAKISWTHKDEVLGVYSYTITLDDGRNEPYKVTTIAPDGGVFGADSTIAPNIKGAETDLADLVTFNNSNNRFEIKDLREFFNLYDKNPWHSIPDGTYTLTVTANDTTGRTSTSEAIEVEIDTTIPPRLENKDIDIRILAVNEGTQKYIKPVIRLAAPAVNDIVSYEVWYYYADIENPTVAQWNKVEVKEADRDKDTGLLAAVLPPVAYDVKYNFQVVAIDDLGNRSPASELMTTEEPAADLPDSVAEALTQVKDAAGNLYYPAMLDWKNGNRETIKQTVGQGDKGDTFLVKEDQSFALTMTLSDLELIIGNKDDIKIEVYKVDEATKQVKSIKVFTAKDDGRIVNDFLLDGNTLYAIRVIASDSMNSSPEYTLTLDKKLLGGKFNDNTDDTAADVLTKPTPDNTVTLPTTNQGEESTVENSNWIGYGDISDYKNIDFATTGRYTFSLSNVAAGAVLTVYEQVKKVNSKGEEKISYKKITSVTANQTKINGVTSKEVVLEAGKKYFYEVKAANKKLIGTEYRVDIKCIQSYPGATTYDDIIPVDKSKFTGDILKVSEKKDQSITELLEKDRYNNDLWVGAGDKVDYFMLTEDSGQYLLADATYQLKLDGIEGNNIKVAIGYLDAKGQFKAIMSKTGAKNTDSLVMHCNFNYANLSKGQLYVQVSANGTNGNSRYKMSLLPYNQLADNTDDTVEMTQKNLKAGEANAHKDWVGFGDNVDFVKLELSADGLYRFSVSEVENNVTVDVLKKVVAENGTIKFIKVEALKATAAKNSVEGKMLLLDASEEYYVSIKAPGANSGKNSDYKLIMMMLDKATALTGDTYTENATDVTVRSGESRNYVYTAAATGGAYEFTLNNTEATGSVKLTVYELLDNGKKRTVKSITVKAGEQGSTGYLWLDDDVVKTSTGIYQVEIKGSGKKVEGSVLYSANGYGFAKYLTEDAVADNNQLNPDQPGVMTANTDWVGMGDTSDTYEYRVNEAGIHEFKLTGIKGNNVKFSIVDASGKVLKKFTSAANAGNASFAYNFAAVGDYKIVVEAAGKNKFAEYTLSAYNRVADAAKLDNTAAMLGAAPTWVASGTSLVDDENRDTGVEGWVGAGDAKDFYGIVITESGNYDLNISNLDNNVKVTLYEATAWNTFDNSIKSGKAVKSVTATADGTACLSGFYLDANKNYYVVVQATSTNGSKNTAYKLDLAATTEIGAKQDGTVTKTDPAAYTFTAQNGAYDVTLTLTDGDKAVVTLYKVNPENGKYIKVKSVTATSKNATVNTGDLSLEDGFSYVVQVTAPNAKNGKSVAYTLNVNNWAFDVVGTQGQTNNRSDNDLATATVLNYTNNRAESSDAVWRVGKDKADWDAVDYYKVTLSESGAYSLSLDGINGNTVKVTIGTLTDKGKFKAVQSVTGKAGSTELLLSRELDANTYYVKVESVKNDTGSEYKLELTNNEKRVGFSNADDTWKQVAGDIDSVAYGDYDTIQNWVGFGDAVDVFKIRLDEIEADIGYNNGRVKFSGANDTKDALIDKEIKLSLVDANGKSVALTFDKESGSYTSKNILMAGVDYYLTVKNSNAKKQNIDYDIDISLA